MADRCTKATQRARGISCNHVTPSTAYTDKRQMLTKDLWAVRLQKLQHAVTFESETDTEGLSSQVFSSQSESEGARSSASSRRKQSVNRRPKEGTPNLLDTICLCYTAILFLRIPVTVADIHGWVNEGELLYYRASRETPLEMKERLPPRYQLLLDSQDLLPPERLHQNVLETLTVLNKDFGMAIPSLNVPLILYRWIKDLALPLEIYAGTQRLAKILKVDVGAFLATETAANVVLRYSEARLMAVLVVATKLLFPLDKISRRCQQATDLSALTFDWDAWVELHQAKDRKADHKPLTFKRAFEFSEADCLEAADHTLDAYLDWYENNIASEEIREHGRNAAEIDFRQTLFTMFPVRSDREAVKSAHISIQSNTERDDLGQAQHPLFHERAVLGTAIPKSNQIGSFYRRYRSVEDLSGPAKVLVERAASSAGVSLESMVRAVFLTEKKLQKHEEHLRKGGRTRS